MWYTILSPLIRHALTAASGYLAARWAVDVDAGTIDAVGSAILGVGGVVLSVIDKRKNGSPQA